MSVGRYSDNRRMLKELTEEHGYKKARRILTGGGAAQDAARSKLRREMKRSILMSLDKKFPDMPDDEIEKLASIKVKEQMSQLAALHDPDIIAGGYPDKIKKMGNTHVNSSLGSQWSKGGRIGEMDAAALEAFNTSGPDAKMNIELERCK
ncbi:polymorphic toxin type 15 domain-containing protein [Ningiella sp. W23]|uniref:polymorphic toxin type 15 domain-containing protein n=1 Tax=Ningiella sp. W23 TaxID=3023715 RepID=UPI0037579BC4